MTELHRKIRFDLDQGEDGWPPATIETLWERDVGECLYELDSIPFFAKGVAWGDVVSADPSDGELLFRTVVRALGHSTI